MKKIHNIFFVALILTGYSCGSYEPIQIQVLKPALYAVPGNVTSIVLLNHANYQKSSFTSTDKSSVDLDLDSAQTNEYFRGLEYVLLNSPRFTIVNDTPLYILKPGFNERYEDINLQTLQDICKKNNADGAIVLENHLVTTPEAILNYIDSYTLKGTLQIFNNSIWHIYSAEQNKIINDYLLKDTLYWDATGNSDYQVIHNLPDLKSVVLQSCYYAGSKYGQRIAQTWDVKVRYLINIQNNDFRNAYSLAKQDKWEQAIELWKKYPYGKNKRLAAFASYNLAVASEVLDHLDIALEWAAKSYLIRNDGYVKYYIETLEKRKKEKTTIENQVK